MKKSLFVISLLLLFQNSKAQLLELTGHVGYIYRESAYKVLYGQTSLGANINIAPRLFVAISHEVNNYNDIPEKWTENLENPELPDMPGITRNMDTYFRSLGPLEVLTTDRGSGQYLYYALGFGFRIIKRDKSSLNFTAQGAHVIKRQSSIHFREVSWDPNTLEVVGYKPAFSFVHGSGPGILLKLDFQHHIYKNVWLASMITFSTRLDDSHEIPWGINYSGLLSARLGAVVKI